MADRSDNLDLPYILPAQAQKHVTHNEALRRLDLLVQGTVLDRTRTEPPAAPAPGARHIVAGPASGAWAGRENSLAAWDGTAWNHLAPRPGWTFRCLGEACALVWDGGAWIAEGGKLAEFATLGINAAADAGNRLAVASAATLLSHEGTGGSGGHRLKVNKAGPGNTASLLFQTGWSGRAEMGTAGSDAFAIKVSADGAAWTTALAFDPASGLASGAAVQSGPGDAGPGRLLKVGAARAALGPDVYGRGNAVGPVAEQGGVPTGALIESGEGATGEYVRFADGTQICTHRVSTLASGPASWTFPRPFTRVDSAVGTVDSSGSPHFAGVGVAGGTSANVSCWSTGGARVATNVHVLAIGRWA